MLERSLHPLYRYHKRPHPFCSYLIECGGRRSSLSDFDMMSGTTEVERRSGRGRCMIATKNLNVGELVSYAYHIRDCLSFVVCRACSVHSYIYLVCVRLLVYSTQLHLSTGKHHQRFNNCSSLLVPFFPLWSCLCSWVLIEF